MHLIVTNQALLLTGLLVLVAIGISYYEKLDIGKEIFIAAIRAIIQLFLIGYVLKYVFHVNNWILTLSLMLIIIFNAAVNTKSRGADVRNGFFISFVAIFSTTILVILVLLFSKSLLFTPSQIVPITGMVASNSMVAIGLCYRSLDSLFKNERLQVIEKLALGATPYLSSIEIIRNSIKTGMQPTIDTAKAVGLVSLPGMMAGLIFAGVDPVMAIKYQIMVTFMLLGTCSTSSIITCYLGYRSFYNNRAQLINK